MTLTSKLLSVHYERPRLGDTIAKNAVPKQNPTITSQGSKQRKHEESQSGGQRTILTNLLKNGNQTCNIVMARNFLAVVKMTLKACASSFGSFGVSDGAARALNGS